MDLSHWDNVMLLRPDETAKLMAGVDPLGASASKTATAKILLFSRLIGEAHLNAYRKALTFAGVEPDPVMMYAPDVFEPSANELTSLELRNGVANLLRAPFDLDLVAALRPGSFDEQSLNRDDIHDWISSQGIKSIYRFNGVGNDFLPDGEIDTRAYPDAIQPKDNGESTPSKATVAPRTAAETRAQNTLLAIIAALADQLHIDPSARGAARRIADFTEHISPVSEDTIKKYLDMIPEVIGRKAK
jgi:hypothetical protein